jgi:CDP-diglyceride synthetase
MKIIYRVILFWLVPCIAFASKAPPSFGGMANSLMEPIILLSDFLGTAAITIGAGCLFGSFLKYTQYRVNPLAAPLSNVFTLLIMGFVLVCLPLAYKLTESGIPYIISVKL